MTRMMLDWLIIGGGIHGTCVALALQRQGADVKLVDPRDRLLARWRQSTSSVGMSRLRSPVTHHLGERDTDLHHFAETQARHLPARFSGVYKRPSLRLFDEYTHQLIRKSDLQTYALKGSAFDIHVDRLGATVATDQGPVRTRHVLVATGHEQTRWPTWASRARDDGGAIRHVFDDERGAPAPAAARSVVVGGGISSVLLALRLARDPARRSVTLVMRDEPILRDLDYDPHVTTPAFLRWWRALDEDGRRRFLSWEPRRGCIPPGLWKRAIRSQRSGRLAVLHAEIRDAVLERGELRLRCDDGNSLVTDEVVLATGFEPVHARSAWLRGTVERLGLPVDPTGLARLDASLHWGHGIFVTGPLAALQLGLPAPNILGARWAARRLTVRPWRSPRQASATVLY
jgi:hypothetical protein